MLVSEIENPFELKEAGNNVMVRAAKVYFLKEDAMKAKEKLEEKMAQLKPMIGADGVARTYLVLADIVHWLIVFGHGEVTLSAVEHRFGLKYRANSVKTVSEMTE